jgi:hypothetical protein
MLLRSNKIYDPQSDPEFENIKDVVWKKATKIENKSPKMYRLDSEGKLMNYNRYECANLRYGWDVERIIPAKLGGTYTPSNLKPVQLQG